MSTINGVLNHFIQTPLTSQTDKSSKTATLNALIPSLEQEPVCFLDKAVLGEFDQKLDSYLVNEKVKGSLLITVNRIKSVVESKLAEVEPCFKQEASKSIDDILSKSEISSSEYQLLYNLANKFGTKQRQAAFFCQKATLKSAILDLADSCPDLRILQKDGDLIPSIINFSMPENLDDAQFLLNAITQNWHLKPLSEINDQLLEFIITKQELSTDKNFKKAIECYITNYKICLLYLTFRNIVLVNVIELSENKIEEQFLLSIFSEPKNYTNAYLRMHLLFGDDQYAKIANELTKYHEKLKPSFVRWYTAVYDKIAVYQSTHPQAALPNMSPTEFAGIQFSFHIDPSLQHKIQHWKEKVRLNQTLKLEPSVETEITPRTKPSNPPPKAKKKRSRRSRHRKSPPAVNSNTPITKPKDPAPPEIAKHESPSLSYQEKLNNCSPFKMNERILKFFEPTFDMLNDPTDVFVHSFGCAVNDVLWKFGLLYKRTKTPDCSEPALTILCQVDHYRYEKSQLSIVTATFDKNIAETVDSELTLDPLWTCYHRTLTKRDQNNEVVAEYLQNAKFKRSFPPLPSQTKDIPLPEEWRNKVWADGSYIEKVRGSVIIVRDPKHDKPDKKCRLYLFCLGQNTPVNS